VRGKRSRIMITHPDKVLFPKSKISKAQMGDYYRVIAKRMIPLIKDRPISLKRFPQGIKRPGFFQKNVEKFPNFIDTTRVKKVQSTGISMVIGNKVDTLVYLANLDTIDFHIWLSKKDKPTIPDRIIFDLDPPKGRFDLAKQVAFMLKEFIEKELKLSTYVMTTGSKGLHVVIPIKREKNFDITRKFARKVADKLAKENPKLITTQQRKQKRKNRIYIDCMRNGYAQTAIAPYSLRSIEKAPIAMPISWMDLKKISSAQVATLNNVKTYLRKANPWHDIDRKAKSITQAENKLAELSEHGQ